MALQRKKGHLICSAFMANAEDVLDEKRRLCAGTGLCPDNRCCSVFIQPAFRPGNLLMEHQCFRLL